MLSNARLAFAYATSIPMEAGSTIDMGVPDDDEEANRGRVQDSLAN